MGPWEQHAALKQLGEMGNGRDCVGVLVEFRDAAGWLLWWECFCDAKEIGQLCDTVDQLRDALQELFVYADRALLINQPARHGVLGHRRLCRTVCP